MGFIDRLKHAWNAFNRDPTENYLNIGPSYGYRPDRLRLTRGNERSIVTSVYNRIAMDVSAVNIKHIRVDESGRYKEDINSGLNYCLNVEANIDQTARQLKQDIVMSLFDDGCVAIVPIETDVCPDKFGNFKIHTMRTGKILDWYPKHVRVEVYNENKAIKESLILQKSTICIIENPLYSVMNEPNSTMQRLMRKLSLLDIVDEKNSSGKLDLIIQLPYIIKTEARRQQAENRRVDIERQLAEGKYGIAYTDGAERITQLNRPVENNLMKQIEYLTNLLYSQLGITQEILNGTADEKAMLNYFNRTIEPILSAITDEMKRKFLTKTARTQMQTVSFFRDPFRFVPMDNIAQAADSFTRNEILTSNEIRQILGMMPSGDPNADVLRNKNMPIVEGLEDDQMTNEENYEDYPEERKLTDVFFE